MIPCSSTVSHCTNCTCDCSGCYAISDTSAHTIYHDHYHNSDTAIYEGISFADSILYSFWKPSPGMVWPGIREVYDLVCLVMIKNISNVFAATFYRRSSFSKSGFIGMVAKRRKGIK